MQRRAASAGFEYADDAQALSDLESEVRELADELAARPPHEAERPADRELEAELGDVLFAAVNVARRIGADPELAVRAAARRFRARVERAEELAAADGAAVRGAGERSAGTVLSAREGSATRR